MVNGNLSISVSLGSKLRCLRAPNINAWEQAAPLQSFIKPEVGKIYWLRGHARIHLPPFSGVLLDQEVFGQRVPLRNVAVVNLGELFFPYDCFCLLGPS